MLNDKIFVIGDVHGCAEELQLLLDKIPLSPQSRIVFVGDYIDRGENSKEVINIILNLQNYYKVTTLMGNHEAMFLDFLADPGSMEAGAFIYNGGSATLASYANQQGKYIIPDEHIDFFKKLQLFSQTESFFFVHAGVPDVPLNYLVPAKHKDDLLWIRESFFNSKFKWEKVIVHGHTPVEEVHVTPKRVNVDTGCVYENLLSAYELFSGEVYSVKKIKRTRQTFLRDHTSARQAVRFEGVVPVTIICDGYTLSFETINYSEIGMLVRCATAPNVAVLKENAVISGEIKLISDTPLKWDGRVVRILQKDGEHQYAIQFARPTRP